MINISIVNRTTVLTDAEIIPVVTALQTQVSRDFFKYWGIDVKLFFTAKSKTPTASHWQLVLLDDSDAAGALGYHDLTKAGKPLGKVFAKTDLTYGYKWSITTSHELLEMIIDPNINLVAFDENASRLYAYEVCDAVEADELGYLIGSIWVSDFVLPGWFEPLNVGYLEKFAFKSKISRPFQLLPGGYIGAFDIYNGSGWTQLYADFKFANIHKFVPPVGSRRERRKRGMKKWKRSTRL